MFKLWLLLPPHHAVAGMSTRGGSEQPSRACYGHLLLLKGACTREHRQRDGDQNQEGGDQVWD